MSSDPVPAPRGVLDALLGSLADYAVIATDLEGRVTMWGAGSAAMTGWSEAEMLGQPVSRVFTPEDRARGVPAADRGLALQHGRSAAERWHMRQDGDRFWAHAEIVPVAGAAGPCGFMQVLRDRTAQRDTAEAQRADAEFVRGVLAASSDCIKVLDLDANLVFMSEGGQRVMEVADFDSIRGCSWPDFWREGRHEEARAAVEAARGGGAGQFRGVAKTMAGNPRWWDVRVTPILGADGQPERLLAISRDITSTRDAEEALREAQSLNTLVLNSSRDCIVVMDLDAYTQFVSAGGIESMDISDVQAVLGLLWLRVWTGPDQEAAQRAVATARAGGVGRFEGFCPTHKGRPKWWDVMVSPLPGPDGLPERLVSIGRDVTARKVADDDAARLASLVQQSSDFIALSDADGRVQFVNQAGMSLVGLADLAAARRSSLPDYFAPAEQDFLSRVVLPAVRQHDVWQGELNFRHFATGAGVPVLYNVFPLRDAHGAVTGYGTVTRDLRELRRASARRLAVLELGERLRDMADPAAMAYVAAEIMGEALGSTRAGYGTIDVARETITIARDWTAPGIASLAGTLSFRDFGTYIDDLKRGETVMVVDAEFDPRTATTGAALIDIAARSIINHPIFEHGAFVALFFLAQGQARHWTQEEIEFVANMADRTRAAVERRLAEQRLRQFAATLERQVADRTADRNRLWQLSADIILVARFDGLIMATNPAWFTVLGWAENELVGHSLFDFIHPDDLGGTREGALALSQGGSLARFSNRCRHKDGGWRWIAWAATPGEALINAVGRDFTAEKEQTQALQEAEERLRQSQKMEAVGQLTGGLAHDFNNLLTGISGSLELLRTRVAQGRFAELDRYVAAAQGASSRAAALTHRLLAFSRRQTLDPKPVLANRLVAEMEELIQRTVGPQIKVETVLAIGLWTTLCDPNQLESALLNLAINARDAMPDGGRLTIETGNTWLDERGARERDMVAGQYVAVCITDTGSGMPPQIVARAFDPFFTTKPLGQGTGLGLSMIYGFAKQSGGQVRIYSEVGLGTTVRIYLPRHWGEAEPDAPQPQAAEAPRAREGETVLVVDDEPTVRMLVTEVLEELGYAAIEAADSVAGLRVLQSGARIDLLITDVGLPGGMNGRQMADAGRAWRPRLKVLFITGYAENAAIGNGHLDPGMQVLTKPFAMDGLAARIKDLIAGD